MKNKRLKLDIILPNRIGECIFALPAMLCLKQLNEKQYLPSFDIRLIAPPQMSELISSLNVFKTLPMNFSSKVKSWFVTADIAIFLITTTKNHGYIGKITYGEQNSKKKFIKYTHTIPYITAIGDSDAFPVELVSFLKDTYNFSTAIIRFFGILIELGYSVEQILETFNFDNSLLAIENVRNFTKKPDNDYAVFCIEAAYNSKRDTSRRWNEENYFKIAEILHEKYHINSVFIGVDSRYSIPNVSYITDLRNKIDLLQLASVLQASKCYIGNDTGPLHIANLVNIPSVSIYLSTDPLIYSPIFSELNIPVINPKNIDEVKDILDKLILKWEC